MTWPIGSASWSTGVTSRPAPTPMRDGDPRATAGREPRPNWLRRILREGPEARRRLASAVAEAAGDRASRPGAIGALVIWHLVRRGRLIRERLDPPRNVRMPELLESEVEAHDQDHGEAPTA